jgi:hypothetical protein
MIVGDGCKPNNQTGKPDKPMNMNARMIRNYPVLIACLLIAAASEAVAQPAPAAATPQSAKTTTYLNSEQREKLTARLQESQRELAVLNERLAVAQREVIGAALAENRNDKAVESLVNDVARIQSEIVMVRYRAFREIASTVTNDEKKLMKTNPEEAYSLLFGIQSRKGN